MILKTFCGSVGIFVVVHERSDCKFQICLSQEMSKFKPGVFKLYMQYISLWSSIVPILAF